MRMQHAKGTAKNATEEVFTSQGPPDPPPSHFPPHFAQPPPHQGFHLSPHLQPPSSPFSPPFEPLSLAWTNNAILVERLQRL